MMKDVGGTVLLIPCAVKAHDETLLSGHKSAFPRVVPEYITKFHSVKGHCRLNKEVYEKINALPRSEACCGCLKKAAGSARDRAAKMKVSHPNAQTHHRARGPPAQPEKHRRRDPPQYLYGHHGLERIRQVLARLRYHLRRRPAPLRRDAFALRAAVSRSNGAP